MNQKRIARHGKSNYKYDFLIGLLAGLAICTKQTIGVFVSIAVVASKLISANNKEEFKQYIKNALVRCIGILLPCIAFVGFLIISGALKDFIDYAIFGIKTFSNSISYVSLIKDENLIIKLLSVILPVFLLLIIGVIIVKIVQKKTSPLIQRIKVMTVFSIAMLIVIYPISDRVHFLVATLPLLIEFLYVIFTLIKYVYDKDALKHKKIIVSTIGMFCILLMITSGTISTYNNVNEYIVARIKEEEFLNSKDEWKKLPHYNNIVVPDYITIREENIRKLINDSDKNVIILDADAVAFNIPHDVYYKNYSMFLKGNIGKDGEDGIIEDIKNSSNCIYIVKKEGTRLNWQTPMKVLEYVRNNLEKQGEVDVCEIYYK